MSSELLARIDPQDPDHLYLYSALGDNRFYGCAERVHDDSNLANSGGNIIFLGRGNRHLYYKIGTVEAKHPGVHGS